MRVLGRMAFLGVGVIGLFFSSGEKAASARVAVQVQPGILSRFFAPENSRLVKNSPALTGWTIVLDPGHGRDPRNGNSHGRSNTGARGVNGVWEDTNTLLIAKRLEDLLAKEGARVYLTRGEYNSGPPGRQSLHNRVALAEKVHANLFISIHQDWSVSATVKGAETFYYQPGSRKFAVIVQRRMIETTGLSDRGVHIGEFYVLKHTTMPAILVEGGFLSNPTEASLITAFAFHQKEADALNRAILEYAQSTVRLRWWPWQRRLCGCAGISRHGFGAINGHQQFGFSPYPWLGRVAS